MFSQASVILSTISLVCTQSLLILVGYWVTCCDAVGARPTRMLSCFTGVCLSMGGGGLPDRDLPWTETPLDPTGMHSCYNMSLKSIVPRKLG